MNKPAFTDADVLRYYPWDGGKGDDDGRTLRDKFVVTRTPATCAICLEAIPVGSRVRAQTQQSDSERKVMTFKFCPAYCEAMGRYMALGDSEAIEKRTCIGMGVPYVGPQDYDEQDAADERRKVEQEGRE